MLRVLAVLVVPSVFVAVLVSGAAWILPTTPAPSRPGDSIAWGDRVFSSREQLASWMASRGESYANWARTHPLADARLRLTEQRERKLSAAATVRQTSRSPSATRTRDEAWQRLVLVLKIAAGVALALVALAFAGAAMRALRGSRRHAPGAPGQLAVLDGRARPRLARRLGIGAAILARVAAMTVAFVAKRAAPAAVAGSRRAGKWGGRVLAGARSRVRPALTATFSPAPAHVGVMTAGTTSRNAPARRAAPVTPRDSARPRLATEAALDAPGAVERPSDPLTVTPGGRSSRDSSRLERHASPADCETCQIEWWCGYLKSRFFARRIGDEGEVIAASPHFRWSGPRAPIPAQRVAAAHEALLAQLRAEGWEPSGGNGTWYGLVFSRAAGSEPPQ